MVYYKSFSITELEWLGLKMIYLVLVIAVVVVGYIVYTTMEEKVAGQNYNIEADGWLIRKNIESGKKVGYFMVNGDEAKSLPMTQKLYDDLLEGHMYRIYYAEDNYDLVCYKGEII